MAGSEGMVLKKLRNEIPDMQINYTCFSMAPSSALRQELHTIKYAPLGTP
jgi:hypothetical protein